MYKYKATLYPPTPLHFLHEREENQIVVFPIFLAARSVHLIHFWGTKYTRGNLVGALGRFGWLSHSKGGCYQPHVGQTFPSSCFKLGRHLCNSRCQSYHHKRRWRQSEMTGPSLDMSALLKTCQRLPSPGFVLGWGVGGEGVVGIFVTFIHSIPKYTDNAFFSPWSSQNYVKHVKDNTNSIIRQYRHASLLSGSVQMGIP